MRDLSTGMSIQLQADSLVPVFLYEGEFSNGTLRLWTGVGEIGWDDKTWFGAGNMISFGGVEETSELRAVGVRISLSGISSDVISLVLSQARSGKAGRLWFGCLVSGTAWDDGGTEWDDGGTEWDAMTGQFKILVVSPYQFFVGKLDVPEIDDSGETCTVSVAYESNLIDMNRARVRRWTNEDQQINYPGDKGFEYVGDLPDKKIVWGGAGAAGPTGYYINPKLRYGGK